MKNISTKSITKIGILSAIVIILSLSPIGFIPLGPVRITTVHIPIILIALIEKPTVSFFVGLIFGLFSFFPQNLFVQDEFHSLLQIKAYLVKLKFFPS